MNSVFGEKVEIYTQNSKVPFVTQKSINPPINTFESINPPVNILESIKQKINTFVAIERWPKVLIVHLILSESIKLPNNTFVQLALIKEVQN